MYLISWFTRMTTQKRKKNTLKTLTCIQKHVILSLSLRAGQSFVINTKKVYETIRVRSLFICFAVSEIHKQYLYDTFRKYCYI